MISPSNMSNPIGSIKPNFGMLTLKHDTGTLSRMLSNFATRSQDKVDRGSVDQASIGQELSMRELAKDFG